MANTKKQAGHERGLMVVVVVEDEWTRHDVDRAQRDAKNGASAGMDVVLAFDGLDDDPREVHEVSDVVMFCAKFAADHAAASSLVPYGGRLGVGHAELCAMYGGLIRYNGKMCRAFYRRGAGGNIEMVFKEAFAGEAP